MIRLTKLFSVTRESIQCVASCEMSVTRHAKRALQDNGRLFDATRKKKAKALVFLRGGGIYDGILVDTTPETIENRIAAHDQGVTPRRRRRASEDPEMQEHAQGGFPGFEGMP